MPALTVNIEGLPIPQGSMVSNGAGRGLRHSNDTKLKPWRQQVISLLCHNRPKDWDPSQPISLTVTFRFPRPGSHFGSGKNSDTIRPAAPTHHIVKPDLDKLLRALGDSIEQSGLLRGDQQISSVNAQKRYCVNDEPPGCLLTLISLNVDKN